MIMNERERIGQRIKEIRSKKKLTQLQLAELTGLRQQHIVRIEKGMYSTGIDILAKIADALEYKIDFVEY